MKQLLALFGIVTIWIVGMLLSLAVPVAVIYFAWHLYKYGHI